VAGDVSASVAGAAPAAMSAAAAAAMIIASAVIAASVAAVVPATVPATLMLAAIVVAVGVVAVVIGTVIVAGTAIVRMLVVPPAARFAASPVVAGLDALSAIVARLDAASAIVTRLDIPPAILRPDMNEAVRVAGRGLRRVERCRPGRPRRAGQGDAAEQQREGDHGGRKSLRLHVSSSSR